VTRKGLPETFDLILQTKGTLGGSEQGNDRLEPCFRKVDLAVVHQRD